jgi:hypothetical protein
MFFIDRFVQDHPHVAGALFFAIIVAIVAIVLVYRRVERS